MTDPGTPATPRRRLCEHMLFKKKFAGNDPEPVRDDPFADELDHYYWCARNMDVVGPDGEIVSHPTCNESRSCWEPERRPSL